MKLKTCKVISKRVKLTKRGKLLKRKAGQDHFNARESGKTRRNKRSDINLADRNEKIVRSLLPYNQS